jgi:hypothetical protein|tara:strand:- start:171 stop:1298 length:1128 start_codon:yes stop_codon:yes gene_type:complete
MSNIVVSGTGSASLSALIQQYYMPVLYDNIFKKSHPLLAILKGKAKTFNGREIVVPVEYADGGVSVFGDQHGLGSSYTPAIAEIAKTASYNPTMLTGHFLLTKEETLLMNSPQAIKNIVGAKVKNLQKGLEKKVAENMFDDSPAVDAFHPISGLLSAGAITDSGSNTVHVGGINASSDTWWKTPVLDHSSFSDSSGENDSPADGADYVAEDDMQDPSKDTYILRILARGIANARAQTGENPDIILCPQYIYDLIESELGEFKRGSLESDRMAKLGFTGMSYRGVDIVADQDMTTGQLQTGDATTMKNKDGRIYFINTNYLYMFFNSGAKFTASDMIEDPKSNTFVQKVHTYGNLVVTNRKAHCVVKNLYSPLDYA